MECLEEGRKRRREGGDPPAAAVTLPWHQSEAFPGTCCRRRAGVGSALLLPLGFFSLNTEIQDFPAPGRQRDLLKGLTPPPRPQLTACTSQTGIKEKGGRPRVPGLPGDGKETWKLIPKA